MKEQILEAGVMIKYQGVPYYLKNPTVIQGATSVEDIENTGEKSKGYDDVKTDEDGEGWKE